MLNWKLSVIAGGIALVLSFLTALISGAGFGHAVLRAGIFAVVFFALGALLWYLINNFLPELLYPGSSDKEGGLSSGENTGSRINISLGDNELLPDMFRNISNSDEVGDIGDLMNGSFVPPEAPTQVSSIRDNRQGVDQSVEDGYTGSKGQTGNLYNDSREGLPDLDLMASSFLGDSEESRDVLSGESEPVRKPLGNKPKTLQGDFNAKELAAGIQTILKEAE